MSGAGQGIDVGAAGAGGGDPPTNFNGEAKVSFRPPRIGEKFSVDVILREFERQNPKFFRASGAISLKPLNLPQNCAKNRAFFKYYAVSCQKCLV